LLRSLLDSRKTDTHASVAGTMPASAFEADSADEVEHEVKGLYSEDD
jgi:hypothetical protein